MIGDPTHRACSRPVRKKAAGACGTARRAVLSPARLASVRQEVLCLLPGAHNLEWLQDAAGKSRVVVSGKMCDIGEEVQEFVSRGGDVRVGDAITSPLLVLDREIAFLPGTSRTHPGLGTIVRAPSLVERLVAVFERHWGRARVPSGDRLMSHQEYEVIVMLASGMTDEAVARKMDISPRTVQRHVHRIMEMLGVHSRLELGIRVTRLGVL
jgi:DNA-binding CsgD family transcriptional regulator